MKTPRIGDPVTFVPTAFAEHKAFPGAADRVQGRVVYVNEKRGYYTVEGICNGHRISESYRLFGSEENLRFEGGSKYAG